MYSSWIEVIIFHYVFCLSLAADTSLKENRHTRLVIMSSRITLLSSRIATNTSKLNDYLEANGLPTPSFEVNGPSQSSVPSSEPEIEAARIAIIDDTQELRRLVLGPRDYLMSNRVSESGRDEKYPIDDDGTAQRAP